VLTTEYPVDVEYPPALRDGYAVRIPLACYGIENFFLMVLFRVSGGWDEDDGGTIASYEH
jgi:hypothetical protein